MADTELYEAIAEALGRLPVSALPAVPDMARALVERFEEVGVTDDGRATFAVKVAPDPQAVLAERGLDARGLPASQPERLPGAARGQLISRCFGLSRELYPTDAARATNLASMLRSIGVDVPDARWVARRLQDLDLGHLEQLVEKLEVAHSAFARARARQDQSR